MHVRACACMCACVCVGVRCARPSLEQGKQQDDAAPHTCQVLNGGVNGGARRVGGMSQVRSTCVSRAKSREGTKHHLKRAHNTCKKALEPCASSPQSIGTSSPTVWTRDTDQIGGYLQQISSCAWNFPSKNRGRYHACGEAFWARTFTSEE